MERHLELLEILTSYISPTPMSVRIIRHPPTNSRLAWVQRLTLHPYLSPRNLSSYYSFELKVPLLACSVPRTLSRIFIFVVFWFYLFWCSWVNQLDFVTIQTVDSSSTTPLKVHTWTVNTIAGVRFASPTRIVRKYFHIYTALKNQTLICHVWGI